MKRKDFTVGKVPKSRRIVLDLLEIGFQKHHFSALLEIDITPARDIFRTYKEKNRENLSFTGWIVYCIGQAVEQHKEINAYRKGRNKIIYFDGVDISLLVEKNIKGTIAPIRYVVRDTNKKTFKEIHDEIREVQNKKVETNFAGKSNQVRTVSILSSLPKFFRRFVWWYFKRNPHMIRNYLGTVSASSVGMFGRNKSGWGVTFSNTTLFAAIGGISKKPGVVGDKIEIREYIDITLAADHDVVDGAPFARFLQTFIHLVESAAGLEGF